MAGTSDAQKIIWVTEAGPITEPLMLNTSDLFGANHVTICGDAAKTTHP